MKLKVKLTGAVSAIALSLSAVAAQADVLFWSTQAKPVEEAQAMRDQVLSGADIAVDYQPNDGGPWLTRLNAELQAGSGSIGVLGALHGDFSAMDDADLVDLGGMGVASASATFNDLAKLGTGDMQYIPWMQASYIMQHEMHIEFGKYRPWKSTGPSIKGGVQQVVREASAQAPASQGTNPGRI